MAARLYDRERDDLHPLEEIRDLDREDARGLLARHEVWICAGIRRRYRVTSWERDHGEFDQLDDAREFLRLLLEGNPHLVERT